MEKSLNEQCKEDFLKKIGLIDTIKTEVPIKDSNEEILLSKVVQQILTKTIDGTLKDKMLSKIDFLKANRHYYSIVGIPEDETGILAVIYFENGQYYLEYNKNDNTINMKTEDSRNDNSLTEKVTIVFKPLENKKQTYVDYYYIAKESKKCDDNDIKEVKTKLISIVYDENDKEIFHRDTTTETKYITINGEELLLEKSENSNSRWRIANEYHLIGAITTKYTDSVREIDEEDLYISRNNSPSSTELIDAEEKTTISREDFDALLDNKKSVGEIMKAIKLTKSDNGTI